MTRAYDVAVCFGTVNRLALLKQCVESIRRAAGSLTFICLIADGNSDDGSREWIAAQSDCELIEGGRNGAVIAFNASFARSIELQCPWIVQFNDDLAFADGLELERAVAILKADESIGAVAFCSDRYSPGVYNFDNMRFRGRCYANQGLFRREAGMAAARAQGDPTGKAWWDPQHHTYAADTVLGCWLWRLGWTVYEAADIRVHDDFTATGADDPLRASNEEMYEDSGIICNEQWPDDASLEYHREDALRFGGRVL
jgi:glycosyltransferase involved in cell wall biosynthesis